MATRDTGDQQRVSRPPEEVEEAAPATSEERAAAKDQLDHDVDAILDEIDEVLEENAEDFVKSFVQKGGQ